MCSWTALLGIRMLDLLAIEAADIVLACSESHRLAIAGAARVLDDAKKMSHAPACALVLGRMDARRGLDAAAPELLAGAFGVPVLQVRQDSLLAQALNSGQMPPEHGRAAEDFAQIAQWTETI
jgi:chromosome partitioning protein